MKTKTYKVTILNEDGSTFIINTVRAIDWKEAKNKTWNMLKVSGCNIEKKKAIAKKIA